MNDSIGGLFTNNSNSTQDWSLTDFRLDVVERKDATQIKILNLFSLPGKNFT